MTLETAEAFSIRRFTPEAVRARAHEFADVLIDAVEDGAPVSFLAPITPLAAIRWALDVADRMERGDHLFAAESDGRIRGLVILRRATAHDQPHRAEVVRLMVHSTTRGQGIGQALLGVMETTARVLGVTLVTLDTADAGRACHLYERMGYRRAGSIPGYALAPDGSPVDTAFYWKAL